MIIWIWLGVGFAGGLLALAMFIHFTRTAVPAAPPAGEELAPEELVRAQIKLAILQDRLEQTNSAHEQARAALEQAAQLRLAATEAAYQRQMLAMQPRQGETAMDSPLTINIHLAGTAAAASPAEQEPPPAAAEPPGDTLEAAEERAAEPAAVQPLLLAPPAELILLAEEATAPASLLSEPPPTGQNELEDVIYVAPTQTVPPALAPEDEVLAEITLLPEATGVAAVVARAHPLALEAPPVHPVDEPRARENPVLPGDDVARFLAVAIGEVEDPFDGIEQAAPQPVAHDDPPQVADAPLEDLDELVDGARPSSGSDSLPGLEPHWQDELDADYVDVDETWPLRAGHEAAPSRWEVLPREDGDMANLEYLDSGVFAVPGLPGWGRAVAVKERAVDEPAAAEEVSFGPTSALPDVHDAEAWPEEPAEKPPEVVPDPQDALLWLDADGSEEGEGTVSLLLESEDSEIEATVAQILAQAPVSLPEAQPETESQVDRQTVQAILARAAEAGVVDLSPETEIMGHVDSDTGELEVDPQLVWVRQPIAWDAAYFDNVKLHGEPALLRKDREIDFDWGPQAPGPGVSAGQFSVRWNGTLVLEPGRYRFTVSAPDGVRLWLNERLVLSAWYDQSPQHYAREFNWQGGSLYVRCEHYEHGPEAHIHFDWQRMG